MDPNATLKIIEETIDGNELYKACEDLHVWLDTGGFEPNWEEYPIAANYFDILFGSKKGA